MRRWDERTPNGERPDRRQWREEGGERVAAVGERRRCVSTKDIRRAPQQDHPYGVRGIVRSVRNRSDKFTVNWVSARIPHPALRATFPPGEGF